MKRFLPVVTLAVLALAILGAGLRADDSAVKVDSASAVSASAATVPSGAAAPAAGAKFLQEPDRWDSATIDLGRLTAETFDPLLGKLDLSDAQKTAVGPIRSNYDSGRGERLIRMTDAVKRLKAARDAGDGNAVNSIHRDQEAICQAMNMAWKEQMDGIAKALKPEQAAKLQEEVAATQILPARPGALLVQTALDKAIQLELTDDQVKTLTDLLAFAREPAPQAGSPAVVFPEGTPPAEAKKKAEPAGAQTAEANRAAADERQNLIRGELGKILKAGQQKRLAGIIKKLAAPKVEATPAPQSAAPAAK
jgi:Spy/CpxP family protein refolding chaperone